MGGAAGAPCAFLACGEDHATCASCIRELCRQSQSTLSGILRCPRAPRECAAPPYALSAVLRAVGDLQFDRLMMRRIDADCWGKMVVLE